MEWLHQFARLRLLKSGIDVILLNITGKINYTRLPTVYCVSYVTMKHDKLVEVDMKHEVKKHYFRLGLAESPLRLFNEWVHRTENVKSNYFSIT